MTTQTLTISKMLCNFIVASEKTIFADSRDYGFDIDEEELARELLSPLPVSVQIHLQASDSEFATHFFLA